MIFVNNSKVVGGDIANILIRVGEGCATNCYNCSSSSDKVSYKSYDSYKEVFYQIKQKSNKGFFVFFYGVESIFHPEIDLFINDVNLSGYKKSLHITPVFTLKRAYKIKQLSEKYKDISFDTCYTIKTKQDFVLVLKFLDFIQENKINATIDLFFDYDKYLKIIVGYFKKYLNYRISYKPVNTHLGNNKCLEYSFGNSFYVLLYHTKEQYIKNKRIYNFPLFICPVKKSFIIGENNIFVSEEIEFTEKGDITVHFNSYCSKAIKKVSSIFKNNFEIISDFQKFDSYLQQYESGDMGVNCFNCISNPYNNEA